MVIHLYGGNKAEDESHRDRLNPGDASDSVCDSQSS